MTATGDASIGYDARRNIALVRTTAYTYHSDNMLVSGITVELR